MSVAPPRRYHEQGLGSRTGLRIGSVRRDSQGNEDLDAFFAESKRVLDRLDESGELDAEEPGSESPAGLPAEADVSVPAERTVDAGFFDMDVSAAPSERRASVAPGRRRETGDGATELSTYFADPFARGADVTRMSAVPPPPPDDTLWESTVDASHDSRSFNLSGLAGDVPDRSLGAATPRASMSEVPSFLQSAPPSMSRSAGAYAPPEPGMDAGLPELDALSYDQDAEEPYDAAGEPDTYSMRAETPVLADEPAPEPLPQPPKKRGRGRPRKSETLRAAAAAAAAAAATGRPAPSNFFPPRRPVGRPPGRQMPPQKIVEKIHDPPIWQLHTQNGLRRGRRHRIPPLDWWRGERALYGRANDEEPSSSDAPNSEGLVAPVLKEVVRVPRAPGEGTFSGMRRFRPKPAGYPGPGRPPGMRNFVPRGASAEGESDEDTAGAGVYRVRHPEDGWDRDTEPFGRVMDADRGVEVPMRIACTASSIRPRPAFNQNFSYEKLFGVGEFMAAGILVIPYGGEKPTKPSKDNNYVFVVLEGAVQVMVHRTAFVIAPGGMFLVPKGNTYNIRNVAQREARIFFAQARNLQTPLASVEHEGQTVFSHGHEGVTARPSEEAEAEARAAPRPEAEAAEERSQPSDGSSEGGSDASESPEDEYAASEADASSDDYDVSRESRRGRRRSSGAR